MKGATVTMINWAENAIIGADFNIICSNLISMNAMFSATLEWQTHLTRMLPQTHLRTDIMN